MLRQQRVRMWMQTLRWVAASLSVGARGASWVWEQQGTGAKCECEGRRVPSDSTPRHDQGRRWLLHV
eukprot:1383772-Rhodomonas_salina.3